LLLAENDLDSILNAVLETRPAVAVVDSIQTVYDPAVDSAPGSVTQVREATGRLMRMAKESAIPLILVGHVTKEGAIAGPRVLEHMVDTVLYLEGERQHELRILRGHQEPLRFDRRDRDLLDGGGGPGRGGRRQRRPAGGSQPFGAGDGGGSDRGGDAAVAGRGSEPDPRLRHRGRACRAGPRAAST